MSAKHPYPTEIELIRFISNVLDLQANKKKIDDNIDDLIINPQKIDELYLLAIFKPLEKIVGKELAEIIKKDIDNIKNDYIKLIVTTSAEFLSRKNISDILVKDFFAIHIANILQRIWKSLRHMPHLTLLFSANGSSVHEIINWLDSSHNEQWQNVSNQQNNKSKVYAWKNGENIPSTQSIKSLKVNSSTHLLILLASAIERIKKLSYGQFLINEIKVNLWLPNVPSISHDNIRKKFILLRRSVFDRLNEDFYFSYRNIDERLKGEKSSDEKKNIENDLNHLETLYEKSPQIMTFRAHIDWLWARFFLLAGELNKAYELYKKLIDSFIYTGGENQKHILDEALVITANLPKTEIFIKKLKWATITFNYDIPSVDCSQVSNRFADNVQEREIEMWKHSIYDLFPKEIFFPQCQINQSQAKVGSLIESNKEKITPDYRNPNRQIKIGDTWSKKMPQLIYFMLGRKYDVLKRLIEEGASINVISDAGETPLMMALEIINNSESIEPDLRFFNLLCKKVHSQEIVNIRTEKLKKSALFLAIDTGRPEVVKQVLELGANPNLLASCDRLSALYYCMSKIVKLKQSQQYKNQILEPLHTGFLSEYHIDSIKRYSNGASGFSNQDIISDWQNKFFDPINKEIFSIITDIDTKRFFKGKSIENYRKIAIDLIDKGAEINFEHMQPIKGYTPFMLAAEIDEAELFKYMYEHGGDLNKTYRDNHTNKNVSIKEIASYFKSEGILDFLNTLRQ